MTYKDLNKIKQSKDDLKPSKMVRNYLKQSKITIVKS